MAWTYNASLIASVALYQVRFLTGDNDEKKPLVSDEEISFMLTLRPGIFGAAADCCRAIAAKFSRDADSVQGDLHTLYSSRSRAYAARAIELDLKDARGSWGMPFAGGISVTDTQTRQQDGDRVAGEFSIGMDDNARAGGAHSDPGIASSG